MVEERDFTDERVRIVIITIFIGLVVRFTSNFGGEKREKGTQ